MINSKKGWIKIAEAFIAVMLIATILLTAYYKQPGNVGNEAILKIEESLLDEIAHNESLRTDILKKDGDNVESFILGKIPSNLDFEAAICEVNATCSASFYTGEVYSKDRIISSNLSSYAPQRLRIFMWEKK